MNGDYAPDIAKGSRATTVPPPTRQPQGGGSDWFHIEVFEWMWRKDGLALKAGPDLQVYATIYRASAHGGGTFYATNASMGEMLCYPRETINRAVSRLLKAGLIWVVGNIGGSHGGKTVKCYAVCQHAIDTVLARISARQLESHLSDARKESTETSSADEPNVTMHHIGPLASSGSYQQSVTERHIEASQCDGTSYSQCDDASHVTKRHIGKNGTSPARLSLFDIPLISTYHISTDQYDEKGPQQRTDGIGTPPCLTPIDEVAFQSLVEKSLRPVDNEFVDQNRREFARIVEEGVPCDVILSAYDDYASYQREQLAEGGTYRPMHLLNWLRQTPNKNIQYLMNARDEQWCDEHRAAMQIRQKRQALTQAAPNAAQVRHTHENPRLSRCFDKGVPIWFVEDDRGCRRIEGSLGVQEPERARALYERMYEHEPKVGN